MVWTPIEIRVKPGKDAHTTVARASLPAANLHMVHLDFSKLRMAEPASR